MTLLVLPYRLFASEHVTCSLRFECEMFQQRFIRIYLLLIQSESLYAQASTLTNVSLHIDRWIRFCATFNSKFVERRLKVNRLISFFSFSLCRYMRYLYPYECDRKNLSTPSELQAAIDGNRREGRRSSYGNFDQTMQSQIQQLVRSPIAPSRFT